MLALALAVAAGPVSVAAAREPNPLADSDALERVECLVRVYVNEGGENGRTASPRHLAGASPARGRLA